FVVPFTRTPLNIAKFTLQRTPFAPVLPSVRKELMAGGVRAELAKARLVTGSMMMASIGMLAYGGIVTGGGPTDPGLRRTLMLTGWQPYSVKVPGGWMEYARLEPLGSIFGMAADFVEISSDLGREEQDSLAVAVVGSLYKNLGSKTFLRGISDVVDAIADPDRELLRALQGALTSSVPFSSLIRQTGQVVNPEVLEARKLLDGVRSLVPGFGPPAKRDIFGEKIRARIGLGDNVLGRMVGMFFPFDYSGETDDPVAKELVKIGYKSTPLSLRRDGVELSYPQLNRLAELSGKGLRKELAKMFLNPGYQRSGDIIREGMVQNLVANARKAAWFQLLSEDDDLAAERGGVLEEKFGQEGRTPEDTKKLQD
ncbi:hypothetical protein LCGC14_2982950, partial [marine sediment metagenome]